jgi:hypothetical protein
MQIDEFVRLDQHDTSVGLAFDPKRGGMHYRFIVANNADGEITGMSGTAFGNSSTRSRRSRCMVLVRRRLKGFC